ncbi:hypothetical protein NQ314_005613 [Rhamnusium bicolor]|uniref:Uncharacterized protein n=1 Tax=Rhamnusium bicolor TaxID=1586634 RepID=A0AAV8ZFF6_9CUCU|nr:hypothetical protein NQ314_005613 [Rhamnusium bicolor]
MFQDRRDAIVALRKKGNLILRQQRNELRPVRKPSKLNKPFDEDYFSCVHCLGHYKRSYGDTTKFANPIQILIKKKVPESNI